MEYYERHFKRFGDQLRKSHGNDYLASLAHKEIDHVPSTNGVKRVVVDSIRNPAEIHFLRERYPRAFFLFGVYASREQRLRRVRNKRPYKDNPNQFDEDDRRDCGRYSEEYGQRVEDCFVEADVVFSNDIQITAVDNEPFSHLRGQDQGLCRSSRVAAVETANRPNVNH